MLEQTTSKNESTIINMGCAVVHKQPTANSVKTEPVLEALVAKNPPKLSRMIKMLNWKSNLRSIPEAKPFMEFSTSVELFI